MRRLIKVLRWLFDPREIFKYENWAIGESLGTRIRDSFSIPKRKSKRHQGSKNKGRRK